jgi:hypothetical protein
MHGTRDEHPEVFKARMAFHKEQKRQAPKDEPDQKQQAKPSKRPLALTRKPTTPPTPR